MKMKTISYRLWCAKCQDFELHKKVHMDEVNHPNYKDVTFGQDHSEFICGCNTQWVAVTYGEMDKDKILEQRERFKKQRKANIGKKLNLFGMMGLAMGMSDAGMLLNNNIGIADMDIVESDAGLKFIEEKQREREATIKEENRLELLQFKGVGRNDKCLCGSELKYKKCCLLVHDKF